jgi:hypothetical protein
MPDIYDVVIVGYLGQEASRVRVLKSHSPRRAVEDPSASNSCSPAPRNPRATRVDFGRCCSRAVDEKANMI